MEEAKKKFQAIQQAYSGLRIEEVRSLIQVVLISHWWFVCWIAVLCDGKRRFLYDVGLYDSDDEDDEIVSPPILSYVVLSWYCSWLLYMYVDLCMFWCWCRVWANSWMNWQQWWIKPNQMWDYLFVFIIYIWLHISIDNWCYEGEWELGRTATVVGWDNGGCCILESSQQIKINLTTSADSYHVLSWNYNSNHWLTPYPTLSLPTTFFATRLCTFSTLSLLAPLNVIG